MSLTSSVKERNLSSLLKAKKKARKSRRNDSSVMDYQDNNMNSENHQEHNREEYKRFPYLFQKYCEDRLCPFLAEMYIYFLKDNDQLVLIDEIQDLSQEQDLKMYIYLNSYKRIKTLICKTDTCIDTRQFFALNRALSHFSNLSLLKLDYCNLIADHLIILQGVLGPSHNSVVELSLAGNPIDEQNFDCLVHCDIKVLVLKFCEITEKGLRKMAKAILDNYTRPSTLIHLDLSHNLIFDEGCKHVASILRCDRSLQSINLTDCKIGEKGFKMLASSFVRFSLNEEEIAIRRKLRFQYYSFMSKEQIKEDIKEGHDNNDIAEFHLVEKALRNHAFTAASVAEDGEIFCQGNNILENLNLAYNYLSKNSLSLCLRVLMEQITTFGSGKGIKRIVLEGNYSNNRECDEIRTTIQETLFNKKFRLSIPNGSTRSTKSSLKRRKSSGGTSLTGSISGKERETLNASFA